MYNLKCTKQRCTLSFSLNLPPQVAKNPLEDPFLPPIPPPLLLSSTLNIAFFDSIISTHTPRPPGGGGGVTAPLMHAHGDEPLVQSHTHTHTHNAPLCTRRNTLRQCSWWRSAGGAVANSRHTGAVRATGSQSHFKENGIAF